MQLVVHEHDVWTFCVACCAVSFVVYTARTFLYRIGHRLRQRLRLLRSPRLEKALLLAIAFICVVIHMDTGLLPCLASVSVCTGVILGNSRISVYRIAVMALLLYSLTAPQLLHRFVHVICAPERVDAITSTTTTTNSRLLDASSSLHSVSPTATLPLDEWSVRRLSLAALVQRVWAYEDVQRLLAWSGLSVLLPPGDWLFLGEGDGQVRRAVVRAIRRVYRDVQPYATTLSQQGQCMWAAGRSGVSHASEHQLGHNAPIPTRPHCSARLMQLSFAAGHYGHRLWGYQAAALHHVLSSIYAATRYALHAMRVRGMPALYEGAAQVSAAALRWVRRALTYEHARRVSRAVYADVLLPLLRYVVSWAAVVTVWLRGVLSWTWRVSIRMWAVYTRTTAVIHLFVTTVQTVVLLGLLYTQYRRRVRREMQKTLTPATSRRLGSPGRGARVSRSSVAAAAAAALVSPGGWLSAMLRHPWTYRFGGMVASMRMHHEALLRYLVAHVAIFCTLIGLHVLPFSSWLYRLALHLLLPWVSSQRFLAFFAVKGGGGVRRGGRYRVPPTVLLFIVKMLLTALLQCTVGALVSSVLRDVVVSGALFTAVVGLLMFHRPSSCRVRAPHERRGATRTRATRTSVDSTRRGCEEEEKGMGGACGEPCVDE